MKSIETLFKKPGLYVLVIVIGVLLKFYQLDKKLFWQDEISTVLYTSGMDPKIIRGGIHVNEIKNVSFYDSLLHPKTKRLAISHEISGILSDTHLTPAHYVFLTLWYRIIGDQDIQFRLFSVFIFIITLPFVFLLGRLLLKSALAGWIAASLFAVSPFINFEAQEARYYILWVFFFVLCNYLFLRAIQRTTLPRWGLYSLASVLALYTSTLSGLFIVGHLVYIFLFNKELLTKFSLLLLITILAYLPWMYFLYSVRETISGGLSWHHTAKPFALTFGRVGSQLFGWVRSFSYLYNNPFLPDSTSAVHALFFLDVVVFVFIVFAILFLLTKTPSKIKAFLILIILPLILVFYISDVVRGSFASGILKYQILNMVGIMFIVTNLLQDKIGKARFMYGGIYIALVVIGISSILMMENNPCWNNRPDCEPNIQEAQLISTARHPLLLTDFKGGEFFNFLAVVNKAKLKNADVMYCQGELPELKQKIAGKGYSTIFIIQASDSLATKVKEQFGVEMFAHKKQPNRNSPQVWQIKL